MSNGYTECACCGEVIVVDDDSETVFCDDCKQADCPESGDDCQIPQCHECCNGDGPRASLMNDGKWHSNCDDDCVNAGKSWEVSA
jgi:hypothetical protein